MTDHALATEICGTLPGAEVSQPFGEGHDVWKVGGKIFAIVAGTGEGISVKTDHVETAALLIEAGRGLKAPYLHASWVRVQPAVIGTDEVSARIRASYALIRASLPRKVQADLG